MADPKDIWRSKTFRGRRSVQNPSHGRSIGISGETNRMIGLLQRGLQYSAMTHFHKVSGLPLVSIARFVGIPQRTLMRRKAEGRFRPDESERLLRLSIIFDKAMDLFEGNRDAALSWLAKSREELGNQSPLDFSRTEIGAREVEDLIGRLEHGVFT